jgi:minichromosome maintenance protein 10
MSHEDLSDYMSGRYYISPSTLYSVATLSPSKEAYEVPVEGDWVTIAVIAHREDVRLSNPSSRDHEGGSQQDPPKVSKYIKLRLVDFGTPEADKSGVTRGDAMLNMLLFEASSVSEIKEDDPKSKGKKVYKGGSGGAFETSAKYHEGAVIAVLSPVVLRPFKVSPSRLCGTHINEFQGSQGTPHPTQNILAVKPRSPDCIQVIGQSKDLGLCSAIKRDGSSCGSWYDKRSSNVCEYHIQVAVKGRRAARPEFSAAYVPPQNTFLYLSKHTEF